MMLGRGKSCWKDAPEQTRGEMKKDGIRTYCSFMTGRKTDQSRFKQVNRVTLEEFGKLPGRIVLIASIFSVKQEERSALRVRIGKDVLEVRKRGENVKKQYRRMGA